MSPKDQVAAMKFPPKVPCYWFELSASVDGGLSRAGTACLAAWRKSGATVNEQVIMGLPFWQTQEITEYSHLILATTESFRQ